MTRSTIAVAALAACTLGAPAVAVGHVTLQPEEAESGGFARLDVRVPNERDDAGTRRVQVRMPPGFAFVSYEPEPGWRASVAMRRAARAIESHGEQLTEEVDTVTFTARSARDVIAPGQFRDFGLSVGVPEGRPGSQLEFKALQTYEGGEVVRWIGGPDSEEPAPRVTLAVAEDEDDDGGDDDGDTLAVIALIVGGLGLAAGAAALFTRARPSRPAGA